VYLGISLALSCGRQFIENRNQIKQKQSFLTNYLFTLTFLWCFFFCCFSLISSIMNKGWYPSAVFSTSLHHAHMRCKYKLLSLPRLRHPRHAAFTNFSRIERKGQSAFTSSNAREGKNEKCVFYFLGSECGI
jgi:hypothetical protein